MVEKMSQKNKYRIYNLNKDLCFSINSRNKPKGEERFQIFLEKNNIFNPNVPDNTIMGYSCGNGASVVSLTECFDNSIKNKIIKNNRAFVEMAKTTLHELSHTFGIDHCVEYHCIMNSLSSKESYKNPIYFCPICLCKLYIGINLDLEKRYNDLLDFYTNNEMMESANWVKKRINLLNKDKLII